MQYEVSENVIIQPIKVTPEELYKQFCLIFDATDYKEIYNILHLRLYNFILKKRIKTEVNAIVLALWHLSLSITFQEQGEVYFLQIVEDLKQSRRLTNEILAIHAIYWEAVQDKLQKDFSPPAEVMRTRLRLDKRNIYTMTIALYMRSIYEYICEYLIDMSLEESA